MNIGGVYIVRVDLKTGAHVELNFGDAETAASARDRLFDVWRAGDIAGVADQAGREVTIDGSLIAAMVLVDLAKESAAAKDAARVIHAAQQQARREATSSLVVPAGAPGAMNGRLLG